MSSKTAFLRVALGLVAAFFVTSCPSVRAQGGDDEIFITDAVYTELSNKIVQWVPGDKKLAYAWSDQPFTVHIPFQMETDIRNSVGIGPIGQAPQVSTSVHSIIYEFGCTVRGKQFTPATLAAGFYRFDGQPLYRGDQKMRFESLPCWPPNLDLNSTAKPRTFRWGGVGPVIGPGRMALFFVMDPLSEGLVKSWTTNDNRIVGKLTVTLDQLPFTPGRTDLNPDGTPAPHWKPGKVKERQRVFAKDFDIVIRQNAWVIQGAKAAQDFGDWKSPLHKPTQFHKWVWTPEGKPTTVGKGNEISTGFDIVGTPLTNSVSPRRFNVTLTIQPPERIWDHRPSEFRSRGIQVGEVPNGFLALFGCLDGNQCVIRGYQGYTWETARDIRNYMNPKEWQWAARYFTPSTGPQSVEIALPCEYSGLKMLFEDKLHSGWYSTRIPYARQAVTTRLSAYRLGDSVLRSTLPPGWTAGNRLGSHHLLDLDIQLCRLSELGKQLPNPPVRRIGLTAMRLSELESNLKGMATADAPTAPEEIPDDGYWVWLVKFEKLAGEHRGQIRGICQKLQMLAAEERHCRQQWLALFRLDTLAHESLGETEGLLDQYIRRPGAALRPTRTKTEFAEMKHARDELAARIAQIPGEQEALIQEALRLQKQLTESAEVQAIRSKERRSQLKGKIEALKDEYAVLRLKLYETARLYNSPVLQQILQEFHGNTKPEDELAKLLVAKMALARADQEDRKLWLQAVSPTKGEINDEPARRARVDARMALLDVLRVNPKNTEAGMLVREMDLELVGGILAKLEGEKKAQMDGFRRYLQARGLDPENSGGWWIFSWEFLSFWRGNGPTSLAAGLPFMDAAAERADLASMVAEGAAKHQVSLLAVRRLLQRGVPLEKIRRITREELQKHMTAETTRGTSMSEEQVGRLCQDIQETFGELADLRALAEGDREQFLILHSRAYYGAVDPEKTGVERLVDAIASPTSLVEWFGPGAVCKIGGKWVVHSVPSSQLMALESAGQVVRTRELMYSKLPLKELGDWLATKPTGKFVQTAFEADRQFLAGASGARRFSRSMAQLFLAGGGAYLAEQHGGPYLAWLVEAVAMLGPDEIASALFARDATQFRKLLGQIDDLKKKVAAERRVLTDQVKDIRRLELLSQRLSSARTASARQLTSAERQEIQSIANRVTVPALSVKTPGASPHEAMEEAFVSSARSLQSGQPAEALRSLQAADTIAKAMAQTLDDINIAWGKSVKVIADNPKIIAEPAKTRFEKILDDPDPCGLITESPQPGGVGGQFLVMGDRAVQRGDFDKADDLYLAALHHGVDKAVVDRRRALVQTAKEEKSKIKTHRARAVRSTAYDQIKDTEDDLVKLLNSGSVNLVFRKGTVNPVFFVMNAQKTDYVFKCTSHKIVAIPKTMGPTDAIIQAIWENPAIENDGDAFAECLAPILLEKIGHLEKEIGGEDRFAVHAPAARYVRGVKARIPLEHQSVKGTVLTTDNKGNPLPDTASPAMNGVLTRFAEGKELAELCEAHVLALKDEMARLRVFRLWLCDTDGHMGNIRYLSDGHLSPIDFGFAQLSKEVDLRLMRGTRAQNQEELLADALKFGYYVGEYAKQNPGKVTTRQLQAHKWVDCIDTRLNYDDMDITVRAIKEFCTRKGGEGLKEALRQAHPAGAPPEMIDEAFDVLTERAKVLEKALGPRFPRFNRPAGVSRWERSWPMGIGCLQSSPGVEEIIAFAE